MRSALATLVGTHDFTSFEAAGSRDTTRPGGKGAVRTIFSAAIEPGPEAEMVSVVLHGDGFLRHMVRNIIGTLLPVGEGRLAPADFKAVLEARDRSAAGVTAPARGLFLQEVFY